MNATSPPAPPGGLPSPPPPSPPSGPSRRLVRLTDQGHIGGVAAGLGWYFGVDPTLVRIGFVVATLATGLGIPAYIVAWIVMPEATSSEVSMSAPPQQRDSRSLLIVALAIVAVTVIVGQIDVFSGETLLAAILIGLGVLLFTDKGSALTTGRSSTWEPPSQPSADHPSPPPGTRPQQSAYEPYAGAWQPVDDPAPRPSEASPPPSMLGRLTVGAWLLAMGAATLLTRLGAVEMTAVRYLAVTVTVVGVGLLLGTVFGRARWLIPVGIAGTLLLVGAGALSAADIPVGGGVGQNVVTVTELADLESEYHWLVGEQTLDLRDLDLEGATATVTTSMLVGHVKIVLPTDIAVSVDGSLRAGDYDILGVTGEGTGLDIDSDSDGTEGAGRLNLTINGLVGEVDADRVERR